MTTVFLYPRSGAVVLVPDAEGSALGEGGAALLVTDYIRSHVLSGDLRTAPDGGEGGGWDTTPMTGVVEALTADTTISVLLNPSDSSTTELAYREGAFVYPYDGGSSTLNLTTGEFSITRTGGFPPAAEVLTDEPSGGQLPCRTNCWDTPSVTATNLLKMLTIVHGTYASAATIAAQADALTGPLCFSMREPTLYSSHASDAPSGGGHNVWFTAVEAIEKDRFTTWCTDYVAAGGRDPEFIMLDVEDYSTTYGTSEANRTAILADSRSKLFRGVMGSDTFTTVNAWNYAASYVQNASMRRAYYETALTFWPNIEMANYSEMALTNAEAALVVGEGGDEGAFPTHGPLYTGSHASPIFYDLPGNAATFYGGNTFDVFKWQINRMRAARRSDPRTRLAPWMHYADVTLTPYHRELAYHVVLSGADRLFLFNPSTLALYEEQFSQYLADLRARLGNFERRVAATAFIPWEQTTVVSGMRVGSTYHWRCTVPTNCTSVTVGATVLPVPVGEYGVWHTTTTSTIPTFVPTYTTASAEDKLKMALVGGVRIEADGYVTDGAGKVFRFADSQDPTHFFTNNTTKCDHPTANVLMNGQLTANMTGGAGYFSTRQKFPWRQYHNGLGGTIWVVGYPTAGTGSGVSSGNIATGATGIHLAGESGNARLAVLSGGFNIVEAYHSGGWVASTPTYLSISYGPAGVQLRHRGTVFSTTAPSGPPDLGDAFAVMGLGGEFVFGALYAAPRMATQTEHDYVQAWILSKYGIPSS